MTNAKTLHKKWLADPDYKAAFEELAEEFEMASAIIAARNSAGLTQQQLADRMNAKQSQIAKLESGTSNTTLKTLQRVAIATGKRLRITFE